MTSTVDDWMYNHEQYGQQQEDFLGQNIRCDNNHNG